MGTGSSWNCHSPAEDSGEGPGVQNERVRRPLTRLRTQLAGKPTGSAETVRCREKVKVRKQLQTMSLKGAIPLSLQAKLCLFFVF